jgi:hypothetical protein
MSDLLIQAEQSTPNVNALIVDHEDRQIIVSVAPNSTEYVPIYIVRAQPCRCHVSLIFGTDG